VEPRILFTKVFQSAASFLPIAEAIAFEIPDPARAEVKVACHLRPSGGTPQQIANSIKAFAQIVMSCANQKRDAVMLIKQPEGSKQAPHYCLAHVSPLKVGGAFGVAIVSPCKDNKEASMKIAVLGRLCAIWQDLLPKPLPIKKPPASKDSGDADASSEPKVEAGDEPITGPGALPAPTIASDTASDSEPTQKSTDS
jgi:hypothetical protein